MFYYSLTFRPVSLMCTSKEFKKFLVKECGVERYYIGEEHGSGNIINHYQCYIETVKRGDKLKDKIVDRYEIKNAKRAVCYSIIHDDAHQWSLGYVQKEGNGFLTNIPKDECKEALEYYIKHKDIFTKKSRKVNYDLDTLYSDVLRMHEEAEYKEFNQQAYQEFLRSHKTLISGTLWQKINDLKLENYVNIMLEL